MRRPGVVVGAVFLLALLFSLGAFAADPARIGQAEAFVELPEDRPRRVQLEDGRLRDVMRYRYIDGMKWEQIAVVMRLDYRWVLRLHGRALCKLTIESHY